MGTAHYVTGTTHYATETTHYATGITFDKNCKQTLKKALGLLTTQKGNRSANATFI